MHQTPILTNFEQPLKLLFMAAQSFRTLGEFIIEKQEDFRYSTGELSRLLSSIKLATKMVNREVTKAGITNILGKSGDVNIQGEEQQKLDLLAHKIFIEALSQREVVCGITSEEAADFIEIKTGENLNLRKYVVLMDPLDGSSNIDVNVSVGTIFSIYRRVSEVGTPVQKSDFLQRGLNQVAAGYIIYGSSTMLVYTTGHGVNGFTLDPSIGTFYLSHPDLKFPSTGKIYSINEGNYFKFPQGVKDYIKYCQEEKEDRPYTSRYIGSLVADFHRNMLKGGIYIYPETSQSPKGKLRLLYEANPIAFLTEQAGGKASDGFRRILEIEPAALHQRVPLFCGSAAMVTKAEEFMKKNMKITDIERRAGAGRKSK